MTYNEAKKLIEKHPLKYFGILGTPGPVYNVHFNIITPQLRFADVKIAMNGNGDNNQKALIDLGLFNENLRVIMVHELPNGGYVREDMYDYLLNTGQLR